MPTERERRRRRILELVTAADLRTQGDVVRALADEGWPATQSSVSRDIAALGLVKMDGVYRRPPRPPGKKSHPDESRVSEVFVSAERSGSSLVVVKTGSGEANHAAVGLDRLDWPEIVGTIAGDDTIFVAVRDARAQRRLLERFRKVSGRQN